MLIKAKLVLFVIKYFLSMFMLFL